MLRNRIAMREVNEAVDAFLSMSETDNNRWALLDLVVFVFSIHLWNTARCYQFVIRKFSVYVVNVCGVW